MSAARSSWCAAIRNMRYIASSVDCTTLDNLHIYSVLFLLLYHFVSPPPQPYMPNECNCILHVFNYCDQIQYPFELQQLNLNPITFQPL